MKIDLLRSALIYIVLVIQIVFEHMNSHFYIGQAVCSAIIIVLNWTNIKPIIKTVLRKL